MQIASIAPTPTSLTTTHHRSGAEIEGAPEVDVREVSFMTTPAFSLSARRRALRLGFVALVDAAPLVVAKHVGFFARWGIDVELRREVGWATIREKVIHGELEAAHAPAAMLWSAQLGLGCPPVEVLTAMVLNLHGNAVTLSQTLWQAGVRDGPTLRAYTSRHRGRERLTIAVPFRYSSHHLLLRRWLAAAGMDVERDVRVVVVPPLQMVQRLENGSVDGFCVGEPWNSQAVRRGVGWCPTWSAAITSGEPEKVLMVRRVFAENSPAEHAAMVAALVEACAWCANPEHHEELATILAGESYLNVPRSVILPSLTGHFECGNQVALTVPDFLVFSGGDVNVPTAAKALAVQTQLVAAGTIDNDEKLAGLPGRLFCEDLHRAARTAQPSLAEEPKAAIARAVPTS